MKTKKQQANIAQVHTKQENKTKPYITKQNKQRLTLRNT